MTAQQAVEPAQVTTIACPNCRHEMQISPGRLVRFGTEPYGPNRIWSTYVGRNTLHRCVEQRAYGFHAV